MELIKQILDYLETEKEPNYYFINDVFFKWYFTFDKEEETFKRDNFTLIVYKKKSYTIAECNYNNKNMHSFVIYYSPKLRTCKIKYYDFYIYKYMDEMLIN